MHSFYKKCAWLHKSSDFVHLLYKKCAWMHKCANLHIFFRKKLTSKKKKQKKCSSAHIYAGFCNECAGFLHILAYFRFLWTFFRRGDVMNLSSLIYYYTTILITSYIITLSELHINLQLMQDILLLPALRHNQWPYYNINLLAFKL